MQQKIK